MGMGISRLPLGVLLTLEMPDHTRLGILGMSLERMVGCSCATILWVAQTQVLQVSFRSEEGVRSRGTD